MRLDIVTIFPGFFTGIFEHGIVRRAQSEGLVTIGIHDLRAFTHDRHRTVDDRPFGGGEGMVLKPEPIAEALASLGIKPRSERSTAPDALLDALDLHRAEDGRETQEASQTAEEFTAGAILLSAQGRPFKQPLARDLACLDRLVLLCGRYEGVDERINELFCDLELSIGDYVLSGGELAAAVVADAVLRLVPGVLGNEASAEFESFGVADAKIPSENSPVPRSQHGSGGLLDYPHYTRPAEFRGLRAPEVLLGGDHREIRLWRREQQLRKTLRNRPDLLAHATLSAEDLRLLEAIRRETSR
ncbi:MAG TPA: tRNA (guanosine(37)-N1)-methyltransferase TrmD [Bryobacteraceae bacterium]|nr:tRNA (guanosine(37)-N1)-methyltransferase TrmD [Bryobacteraceae bacterium]